MPRLAKQKRHLASIAQSGVAPKRPKLTPTPMEEDQVLLSEYEEDGDSRWEVDESVTLMSQVIQMMTRYSNIPSISEG
jgi:hypothetical protein